MKKFCTRRFKRQLVNLLPGLMIIFSGGQSIAQLNPLAGFYFTNEYLGNPAMAGTEQGLHLNLSYRKQWSSISGAPETQSFTADYGTGKKVGLGLNVNSDNAGLIKRTRVTGTYTYHLPLSETEKLSFGISFGFMNERILTEAINGDQDDNMVSLFNNRETYLDGDFGIAYRNSKLTIQAAVPDMKNFFQKNNTNPVADRSYFFSAVSYKFNFTDAVAGLGIEPKFVYRAVTGFDNMIDIGANLTLANGKASLMSVYHTSKSATFGMGTMIKSFGSLNANYTTSTAALSQFGSGSFQIGLKLDLFKDH